VIQVHGYKVMFRDILSCLFCFVLFWAYDLSSVFSNFRFVTVVKLSTLSGWPGGWKGWKSWKPVLSVK